MNTSKHPTLLSQHTGHAAFISNTLTLLADPSPRPRRREPRGTGERSPLAGRGAGWVSSSRARGILGGWGGGWGAGGGAWARGRRARLQVERTGCSGRGCRGLSCYRVSWHEVLGTRCRCRGVSGMLRCWMRHRCYCDTSVTEAPLLLVLLETPALRRLCCLSCTRHRWHVAGPARTDLAWGLV